jgi:endonuclease-3
VKRADIAEFYRLLADRTPDPRTELESVNEFTLLVAVVLSAQATDASVNLATRDLFATVTTPAAMLELGEERLREQIKTIGLFNTKVMNTAFGAETFAVDTHVFRVGNRTGLAPGKTPLEVEAVLDRVTPAPYRRDAHHLLILHGRYVCKARRPECWRCVVAPLCRYTPKTPPPGEQPAAIRKAARAPGRTEK